MWLSTRSRYGTRLMLELALNYNNGNVFLKDVAREEGISEKYLSQLVIPLKARGLISATRGAKGGMIISGEAGAVQPGATVTITDSEGHTVTTTADENEGFTLVEADLPIDFDHSLGNELSITQESEGCTESDAVDVGIGV